MWFTFFFVLLFTIVKYFSVLNSPNLINDTEVVFFCLLINARIKQLYTLLSALLTSSHTVLHMFYTVEQILEIKILACLWCWSLIFGFSSTGINSG